MKRNWWAIAFAIAAGCSSSGSDALESPPSRSPRVSQEIVVAAPEGVLGWWDGGTWVQSDRKKAIPVKGGERYRVLSLGRPTFTTMGSTAEEGCELGRSPGVGIDFHIPTYHWHGTIAVSVGHNLQPRRVKVLAARADVYRTAARDVLRDLGISEARPEIAEVVRADLDADGKDEVTVITEKLSDQKGLIAEPGDYSVIFLRRVVGREVATSVVRKSLARTAEAATPFIERYRVATVADVNGDGRMEVAVQSRYYEGSGTSLFELKRGKLAEVLSAGCGA